MDEATSTTRRGYNDMQGFPNHRPILHLFATRTPRAVIILTVLLGYFVLFFTMHTSVAHYNSNEYHAWTYSSRPFFTKIASLSSHWNTRNSHQTPVSFSNHYWQMSDTSDSRSLAFPTWFQTRTTCVEDFVQDERVKTGDCNNGRLCRARVVVSKQGTELTVQVGYNIFYDQGVTSVNARIKRNVKAVKRAEANKWAKSLLMRIKPNLEALNCEVSVVMISDALMESKNDAARCPMTDDPLCTQLRTINTCAVIEPSSETDEEKQCVEFLESKVSITDLEDLEAKSSCAGVRVRSNHVYMIVPLCKTYCAGSACPHQERTIFANMSVRGGALTGGWDESDIVDTRNSMAAVFLPAYNSLIANNVPSCDDMTYGTVLGGEDYHDYELEYLVAYRTALSRYPNVIPQDLQDIAAQNHGGVIYDVRYRLFEKLADQIASQCSLGE